MERIILAYSGGLETSVAIPWLADRYGAEIVAVTLDLGHEPHLEEVKARALAAGAVRCHVIDVREAFMQEYVLPALLANARYEDQHPMATALSRPIIAKTLVDIARMERAGVIAHGCSGKGNDQARIELAARALDPSLSILAPARLWEFTRPESAAYAEARGIPVAITADTPYSVDANLWGRSIEYGVIEDPWQEPPEEIYTITRGYAACPDTPAFVEIGFDKGVPVSINGVSMSLLELVDSLTTIAGEHGVGRLDVVENRVVGIKSREVYEAPAAVVLHLAHRELERFVTSAALQRFTQQVATQYADVVYNGFWFTPLRQALDAFVGVVQERVTGAIRLRLFKGDCRAVGRQSPYGLYDRTLATYGSTDQFDHAAAEGFVKLYGLPVELAARIAPARPEPPKAPWKITEPL
jgi:argininosuccinate synthase